MPDSGPVDREALRKQITELGIDAKRPGLLQLESMSEEEARRLAEQVERLGKALSDADAGFSAGPAGYVAVSSEGVLEKESEKLEPLEPLEPKEGPGLEDTEMDADMAKWCEELAFFDRIRDELAGEERYWGKYVAVKDKHVIDVDVDDEKLIQRIDEKYPREVVLIARVGADGPVGELPSPEFVV